MEQADDLRVEALELIQQSRMLLGADKVEEAKAYLDRALEKAPMCAEVYDGLGIWNMVRGDYQSACEQFKKALLIEKNLGETYFNLGNACMMLGQRPQCLDAYNRAISAGYDQAEMQFFMALAYEQSDEPDMALRHLTRAIMKDPSVPDYKVKKAHILIQQGRLGEALDMAKELIRSSPELFDGYHLRTSLLQQNGNRQEALDAAKEASDLFPEDVSLYLDYVRSEALAEHYDKARQLLNQARQMQYFQDAQREFARLEAELCAQQGDMEAAIKAIRSCIELEEEGRTDGAARQMLMNLCMATEDFEGLRAAAEELVAREEEGPYYRAALYYWALALKRLSRTEEATAAYRKAVSIYRRETLSQPGLLDSYLYRAMSHRDLEEYDQALEMLDYIQALDEQLAEVYIIRAEIYRIQSKDVAAETELERAFTFKPELRKLYATAREAE